MADEMDYFKAQRVAAEYGLDYNAFCAAHRAMLVRLESAATPAEVGERHVRHEGGGVIALYEGDQRIREIGVAFTAGWDHRDRDEFIVRYNEHATLARQLAEARTEADEAANNLNMMIVYWREATEQAESQLAEATRRLETWLGTYADSIPAQAYHELCAIQKLTKEPTK